MGGGNLFLKLQIYVFQNLQNSKSLPEFPFPSQAMAYSKIFFSNKTFKFPSLPRSLSYITEKRRCHVQCTYILAYYIHIQHRWMQMGLGDDLQPQTSDRKKDFTYFYSNSLWSNFSLAILFSFSAAILPFGLLVGHLVFFPQHNKRAYFISEWCIWMRVKMTQKNNCIRYKSGNWFLTCRCLMSSFLGAHKSTNEGRNVIFYFAYKFPIKLYRMVCHLCHQNVYGQN